MPTRLPQWAQKLLDRHPHAPLPSANDVMPTWLEGELSRTPLWAFIRGIDDVRNGHPYFLIEDVRSQPDLMDGVLALKSRLGDLAQRIIHEGTEHLVYVGCGSAFFSSIFGAFLFRHWTGLTTESWESLEFTNYWLPISRKTALIAQSATGGSIETLDAVRRARDKGLFTLALTNTVGSAVEELCDETVAFPTGQRCGPDISVITTRLMMMYLLAVELGRRNGTLNHDRAEVLEHAIRTLPEVAVRFLEQQDASVAEIAAALHGQHALLFVGGGPNWFSAREGALKVEEECSMVCKAYRPAEYPHDAIALLSPEVTTVVIAPPGTSYQRSHDSLRTGKAAGSRGLAFVVEGDDIISRDADYVVSVPGDLDEMLFPPIATMFSQLLGYYLGLERGYNPDTLRTDNLDHARAWLTSFPLGKH